MYFYYLFKDYIYSIDNPLIIFIVVASVWNFMKERNLSDEIQVLYKKHGNSIIVSNYLSLLKNKIIDFETKNEIFMLTKKLKLYPIKGKSLSWKTTILIPFLNIERLYKLFLKYYYF